MATKGIVHKGEIRTDMLYSSADPLAVRFRFHNSMNKEKDIVDWRFARDLLRVGCTEAVGDGDVRIKPTDDYMLRISLYSPHARDPLKPTKVRFYRAVVERFLADTVALVPFGEESDILKNQFNRDIEALLDQG